jgi:hypothetical protein
MEEVMDAADDDVMGVALPEEVADACAFKLDPDELTQLKAMAGYTREITTVNFYCDLCETELRDEMLAGVEWEYNDPRFRVRVKVEQFAKPDGTRILSSARLAPGSASYEGWKACAGTCNADICCDCFQILRSEAEAAGTDALSCPICHGPLTQKLCAERTRECVEGRRDAVE